MKVSVIYNTTDAPHGGGNQFIKALKSIFESKGVLSPPEESNIILFNSHHNIDKVMNLKNAFPEKTFVHRVDGPMRLYNDMSDSRDSIVYRANDIIADATIFQSEWSKKSNLEMGMKSNKKSAVILNGVDTSIFYASNQKKISEKTRLISASFSPNPKKGFDVYRYIDENLDFDSYEYYFAGNSPIRFKNIKNLGKLTSVELADQLRKSDVFLTASQKDPCSNSLMEAISCDLKILALSDGGHLEITDNPKCLFSSEDQLLSILKNRDFHRCSEKYSIEKSAEKYLGFFLELIN